MPAAWADAGSAPYNNITDTNPQMINPDDYDFRLHEDSPAKGYGCETVYIPEKAELKTEKKYTVRLTGSRISLGGIISENTVIEADTVDVYKNITIGNNTTLNITPGTVFLFHGPYNLIVEGTMKAEGTSGSRIIFTSSEHDPYDDYTVHNFSWSGIIFDNTLSTNDSSSIRYCIIEYAKSVSAARDRMRDYAGGAVFVSNFSKLTIENNIFRYNTAIWGAAVTAVNNSGIRINNNLFYKNYAEINASVACFINCYPFFYNNTLTDNVISKFDGNYQPGAVFNYRAKPFMANNIITRSHTYDSPQAHYCKPYFTWNNDIRGISGYNDNIDEDPAFDGSQVLPGVLSKDSPCIDSGISLKLEQPEFDLLGNQRMINGKIDMGAFEDQVGNSISEVPVKTGLLRIYPNPANPVTRITFDSEQACMAQIIIYDTTGELVEKINYPNAVRGSNSYDIRLDRFVSGLYFVRVITPDAVSQGKVLLLK